jgi:toxin ParE1/3/4
VKVFWTALAEQDREDIFVHIAADNPRAAVAMDELFSACAERLCSFPQIGKPGLVAGTRELIPHENYRLVYEINQAQAVVWILALIHTARRWPPLR